MSTAVTPNETGAVRNRVVNDDVSVRTGTARDRGESTTEQDRSESGQSVHGDSFCRVNSSLRAKR